MNHYIDIKIKPDAEMRENVLMNKAYTKFHKALNTLKSNRIGVSFPDYEVLLGKTIRIHGEESALNDLQGMNWLGGLVGYCDIGDVACVPESAKFRVISRIQSNMTLAKLNRLIKRGTISDGEIKSYKAKLYTKGLANPYVELESSSNGNQHRRYFKFGPLQSVAIEGDFDEFGLSKTATVPWF